MNTSDLPTKRWLSITDYCRLISFERKSTTVKLIVLLNRVDYNPNGNQLKLYALTMKFRDGPGPGKIDTRQTFTFYTYRYDRSIVRQNGLISIS